jgi:FkbM family methyltransferase
MFLACNCSYPNVPVWKWQDGSVLDVRRAVNQSTQTLEFVTALHSTEGTHTDGPFKDRPMWVPVLTTQVSYAYAATPIAPLPCNRRSRGEDSVLFRTFFFTLEGMPLLGPGVFVETGAHDGIVDSATFFFEKCLGWAGVLIEPHPVAWPRLLRAARGRSVKRQAAVCARNGTTTIEARDSTSAKTRLANGAPGLSVPCAPLWQLLHRVSLVRRTGRVDLLSLDVEGAEPIAAATLGKGISYGVVMAEVEIGERRIRTMRTMLARGFHYAGQISARPSSANYVISDVWYNRSHFQRFWPRSRVLFV